MDGLILFSYNLLDRKQDLAKFYEHLFHGNVPDGYIEQRMPIYDSFGLSDPLTHYTTSIAGNLLEENFNVYIACKHSPPSVESAVEYAVLKDECKTLYMLALTPFISKTGTIYYEQKVRKYIETYAPHVNLVSLNGYGNEREFIHLIFSRIMEAFTYINHKQPKIIFTSHSLPGTEKSNAEFIAQLEAAALSVIRMLPKPFEYRIAYRSAGPKNQKWLGPDILYVLSEEKEKGTEAVIVCELLSIIENMEVIEEIGKEAKEFALDLGMEFIQTRYLNNSYEFVSFLKRLIQKGPVRMF